jgi:type IV secretion system protein VirB3
MERDLEDAAAQPPQPLFVGVTRPAMRWGVTFSALLANGVLTMNVFLFTGNLAVLLLCLPVHGVCVLLCARDARIFDLLFLWARTGLAATARNRAVWHASSYSPLVLDLPNTRGRRCCAPQSCGPQLGWNSVETAEWRRGAP